MAEDYEYDVFVSHRRKQPVMDWVKNHFYPLLEQWLPNAMPVEHKTLIFIDWEGIQTGSAWPVKLQQALKRSRCLLPVWMPEYFRSDWCLAEWKTMMERERLLGLRTEQRPEGLIYPVVFFDGELFPEEARNTQQADLRDWNYPYPHFRDQPAYLDFDRRMQSLVKELAGMIGRAPAWQDWPVITPIADEQVVVKLPRLKMTEGSIVTFYSYKGGVGRTLALANVGALFPGNVSLVAIDDGWKAGPILCSADAGARLEPALRRTSVG